LSTLSGFFQQVLGCTKPRLPDPAAADRWTWLTVTANTQLHLARDLTIDPRHPWERRITQPGQLTPARFRHFRATMPLLAGAPKPTRPGPGRPGSRNRQIAAHPPVGKTQHQNATQQSKE
jgi:hypothetical protein